MITTSPLITYQNGNVTVSLYEDGTKTREWDGKEAVLFPETIDIKVTDYCDAGCAWCHESSTKDGKHANLRFIKKVLRELPPGIELAIGGGNPLAFPDLHYLLDWNKERQFFSNLTVNEFHVRNSSWLGVIQWYLNREWIKGIGVSYRNPLGVKFIKQLNYPHVVVHMIAGVNSYDQIARVLEDFDKVLILGFKSYGRGASYGRINPLVKHEIFRLKRRLPELLQIKGKSICFDNLAIEQLDLKRILTPEAWDQYFMGNDGTHTGYIDFVTKTYATTSFQDFRMDIPKRRWNKTQPHWLINQ